MPYRIITRYTLHALGFGLIAGLVWLAARLVCFRRPWTRRDGLWLVSVVYVGMVLEIIGLRFGLQAIAPLSVAPRFQPLYTTIEHWHKGPGQFIYHVFGNLLWFVPVGMLVPRLFPGAKLRHAVLAGLALSLLAEALQYLLGTGLPDIDDVALNILGTLAGGVCGRLLPRRDASSWA